MPLHPASQTYRDCAALSRLQCTQSSVGVSTYIEHTKRPNQKHTLNSYTDTPKIGCIQITECTQQRSL